MTMRPEEGPGYGQEKWEPPEPSPTILEEERGELFEGERELYEHEEGGRRQNYLDPEDNELHAPGQACQRCGMAITATQEARRLLDGHWVHEICPIHRS